MEDETQATQPHPARRKRTWRATVAAVGLGGVLLVAAGWHAHARWGGHPGTGSDRRVRPLMKYRLTSPLLDVELPEGFDVRREPIPFKYKVKAFVEDQIASGAARDISVYFRDMADGPWFGINEKAKFHPASLMKVPVMIAWLKRAERDPEVLARRLVFDETRYPGVQQATPPARTLVAGGKYTVDELLEYMLRYSDNRAMWLLYMDLSDGELGEVLDNMDVTTDPGEAVDLVSAHGYSGFFRILYNAAYLNRTMSEKALELLAHQDFAKGIQGGIPRGVVVASKFGENVSPGAVELHEFGIVYHAKGPYILGVMTRGEDLARQAEIIQRISAMIYAEIDAGEWLRRPR